MNVRKLVSVLLCLVMIFSVTACEKGGETEPAGTDAQEPAEAAEQTGEDGASEEPEDTDAADGEGETIRFWNMYWGNDAFPALAQELIDEYNDTHDGPDVELQMRPWATYYDDFMTAVTSGSAPDIACGALDYSLLYGRMGELVDLTSILDEWTEEGFIDNFYDGALGLHNIDGCQYGIPWCVDMRLFFYNMEMFKKAGVTVPERGYFTFEELYQACRKLKASGVAPMVEVGTDFMNGQCINYLLVAGGGNGPVDENCEAAIDSGRNVEIYEWIRKMVDEKLIVPESVGYTADQQIELFATDKCAIITSNMERMIDPDLYGTKYGVLTAPVWDESEPSRTIGYINPMIVFSQTEYPEACKQFVKWWIENDGILFERGAANFSAVSTVNETDAMESDNKYRMIIEDVMPYLTRSVYPYKSLYNAQTRIGDEVHMGHLFTELLENKVPIEELVDKYQLIIEQIVAENPEPQE